MFGAALAVEGQNRSTSAYRDKQFAGGVLLVSGAMLTVGGWLMFAANGKPSLSLQPLRPASPALER